MGWAYGINDDGREIGYGVAAECDEKDCHAQIDRGFAYCCGGSPFSEYGCHGYFCGEHLYYGLEDGSQGCAACCGLSEAEIGRIHAMLIFPYPRHAP